MTSTETPLTDEEIERALREEDDAEAAEQDAGGDGEAPYGRFKNGKPRKAPPGEKPRSGRASRPKAPRRSSKARSSRGPDYEGIIGGLLQAVSIPLMAVSPLDVVAIADHGENVARAAALTASERPEVAAVLDKLATVGPYSILLGAVTPLLTQIFTNHRMIPPMLGAKPREVMEQRARAMWAQMRGQAEQYAEQAA